MIANLFLYETNKSCLYVKKSDPFEVKLHEVQISKNYVDIGTTILEHP